MHCVTLLWTAAVFIHQEWADREVITQCSCRSWVWIERQFISNNFGTNHLKVLVWEGCIETWKVFHRVVDSAEPQSYLGGQASIGRWLQQCMYLILLWGPEFVGLCIPRNFYQFQWNMASLWGSGLFSLSTHASKAFMGNKNQIEAKTLNVILTEDFDFTESISFLGLCSQTYWSGSLCYVVVTN